MTGWGELIALVVTGVLGLAIVAVLVGQKAQTSNVISTAGSSLSSVITAAVGPVM